MLCAVKNGIKRYFETKNHLGEENCKFTNETRRKGVPFRRECGSVGIMEITADIPTALSEDGLELVVGRIVTTLIFVYNFSAH